jgi:hypothetical protein
MLDLDQLLVCRWQVYLTGIEFIAVSDPFETSLGQVIQRDQIVVTGDTMQRADSDLMKTPKQVLGDIHGILELPGHDIGGRHDQWDVGKWKVGNGKEKKKLWDQRIY